MRPNQPMNTGPINTGGPRPNDPFNQPSNNPFAPSGGNKMPPTQQSKGPGLFGGPAPTDKKPPMGGAGLFG